MTAVTVLVVGAGPTGLFTALALGLALPYLVLSWQPALTSFLPRPGAWMVRLKQLLAHRCQRTFPARNLGVDQFDDAVGKCDFHRDLRILRRVIGHRAHHTG